jgi:hypothetical protein
MKTEDIRRNAKAIVVDAMQSGEWYKRESEDDSEECVESQFLGTVFALYPSGKYYTPFANSNVDVCPRCKGMCKVKNAKEDASACSLAMAEDSALRTSMMAQYGAWANGQWPEESVKRLESLQKTIRQTAAEKTCPHCHGEGSREAYEDGVFSEALESAAEKVGAWIESGEGDPCDVFLARHCAADGQEEEEK